jgi:hypothetical protein
MKFSSFCLGLFLLAAVSCKRDREIKVYDVAKESTPAAQPLPAGDPHAGLPGMTPGTPMAGGTATGDPHAGLTPEQMAAVGSNGSPQFTDTPPAHWKKQALSPMRLASYQIQGEGGAVADLSFSILRRAPGGTLANINRWRDQLAQPPIDEAALAQNSQTIELPLGKATVVDLEGLAPGADANKDGRLIGAIAEVGDEAWFFKMRGNAALTAGEKANFIKWIQTVKPAGSAAPGVPAPPAPVAPAAPAPAAAGDGSVTWQVPAGWKLAPTAGSMRYATFNVVAADGGKGEIIVSHFPGDVGGDLENVNRWCQQVGAPVVDQAGLAALITKLTAGPQSLSLVDVTGPQTRLVAGWTRHGKDTWFFKFTGPDALVGAEKAGFTAFLESVRFTQPE